MAKLTTKERNLMRARNIDKFKNNIKSGDVNRDVIPPSQLRHSGIGKGDHDRSDKEKYDKGYEKINWRRK